MNLEIRLEPHVGKKFSRRLGIEIEVQFDQFKIMAGGEEYKKATGRDGVWLGLVGMQPGAPINWLPRANEFPPAVRVKMAESVQAELARRADADQSDKDLVAAGETRKVNDPPPVEVMEAESPVSPSLSQADDDENL